MLRQRRQRPTAFAFLSGCAATGLALIAYALGWLDAAENRTINWRFRYPQVNSIPFSPELVSIDIDDTSLALVGRWPWPRDVQAALISVPARCGAKAILVDLDWSERQSPRLNWPQDGDLTGLALHEDEFTALAATDPDLELRAAIREAPPVFPAFSNFASGRVEESREFAEALASIIASGEIPPSASSSSTHQPAGPHLSTQDRLRLAAFFHQHPREPDNAAADALALPAAQVVEASLACRLAALRVELERWWNVEPARKQLPSDQVLALFYEHVSGQNYFESGDNPLRQAVAFTVRYALSYRATLREPLLSDSLVTALAVPVQAVLPVHFVIAEPCRRPGFVNFHPDSDGVFRRETLFERHGTNQTTQLALGLACELWGIQQISEGGPDRVVLEPPRGAPLTIQLDRDRRLIVPWTTLGRMNEASRQFVPAAKLCEVQTTESQIELNESIARAALKRIASLPAYESLASIGDLIDAVELAHGRVRKARLANQPQTLAASREMASEYESRLSQERQRLFALRQERLDASRSQPQGVAELANDEFALLEQVERVNARLRSERDALLAELRRCIEGKICLIGYTATALADMKPTPLAGSMPGVRAHLNLLNGLLLHRTVRWSGTVKDAVIAGIAGVLISLISATRRAWALPALVAGVVLVLLVAGFAFYLATFLVGIVPVLTAMLLSYVVVALFQFSFVDKERRTLTKTLGQYTSATLARRMAEQPELCRRAEVREVSAVFTDLEGFTSLSESIGAERTQRLLNVSLGRLSEVLLRHEAMINKFMGDGVFAFWNPLIHPQPDHAPRACSAALEMIDAVAQLARDRTMAQDDAAFAQLRVRVGLAAGNAVVGPCGSEQKYDYTCIGDSVNLASRLEAANKVFGTQILTNERIRELTGAEFVFRPLGRLQVKGKTQDVPIYELLGRHGAIRPEGDGIARFEEALLHFQARRFDQALQQFERVLVLHPQDRAVQLYIHTTQRFLQNPPPEDWRGALELTEK